MRNALIVVVAAAAACRIAHAADDFCAVSLTAYDTIRGDLTGSVPVELHDPYGKIVLKTISIDGRVDICDFGFGPHSIVIGDDIHPVVIRQTNLERLIVLTEAQP